MKLRTGEPWMPAPVYGRSLKGLTINLLVRDVDAALVFQREVLQVELIYQDPDFAVLQGYDAGWMLHADHTYDGHAMFSLLTGVEQRGTGAEFRLHGCDPDRTQAAAQRLGYKVLAPAVDKGHGLREVYLMDADGYIWVPDVQSKEVRK